MRSELCYHTKWSKKKKKKKERKKEKPVRFKLHASLGFIQTQKLQYFVLISKGYLSFPG
jgi:hypothetical protein